MVLLRYQNPAACLANTPFLNVVCAGFLPFSTFRFLGNLKQQVSLGINIKIQILALVILQSSHTKHLEF